MLLEPELLAALERMQLNSRRPLAGQLSGGHRSKRHGSSLDFSDFREYQPGDDFRRIDYLTLARLDQLVVRLYEADDDLTVDLAIDTSASMGLDGKLRRAVEVASAVGFVALLRRDTVRLQVPGVAPRRFTGRRGHAQLDSGLSRGGLWRQALADQVVATRVAMKGQLLVQLAIDGVATGEHRPPFAQLIQHGMASSESVSSTRRMASTSRCQSAVSAFSR